MRDQSHETIWHKSTYSNGDGDCVEVAAHAQGIVPVRDSKDPNGPTLAFTPDAWQAFVRGIQAEDFPASL